MSLFQRIKTPFDDVAPDMPIQPGSRVGTLLRERREELGFDLDAVGEALRIKPIYLAALEEGRAQDLPGATYAIGFIRAYAQLLDLDSERILENYKAESADVHARPDLSLPVPLGARSLPGGPILLVGVILALCFYGTWYYLSTAERTRPERVAAVPAELQRIAQGSAAAVPAGPSPAPSKPTPGPPFASGSAPGTAPGAVLPGPRLSSGLLAPQQDLSPALSAPAPVSARPGSASSNTPGPNAPNPNAPNPSVVASPAGAVSQPVSALPAPAAAAPPANISAARSPAAAVSPPAAPPAPVASAPPTSNARETPAARPDARIEARTEATAARPDDGAVRPGGRVDIRALADCWIQVRSADQTIVFSRVLKAGETYNVPRAGLVLRTGNAGALAIVVDGKPAPTIGGIGTLRRNVALDPEALLAGTAVQG